MTETHASLGDGSDYRAQLKRQADVQAAWQSDVQQARVDVDEIIACARDHVDWPALYSEFQYRTVGQ